MALEAIGATSNSRNYVDVVKSVSKAPQTQVKAAEENAKKAAPQTQTPAATMNIAEKMTYFKFRFDAGLTLSEPQLGQLTKLFM